MRIRLLAATAAVCCAAGGSLALPALGDTAADPPDAARHCVQDVTGRGLGCFTSYTDAIRTATRGAIDDAPADAAEAVRSPRFRAQVDALAAARGPAAARAGTVEAAAFRTGTVEAAALQTEGAPVIGATLFSGTGYTGNSETIMIAKPCVKDGWYDYTYLPTLVTRSAQSVQPWANCWVWLHDGESTDSTRQGPYKTDTPDLGDWKNRAVLIGLS